MRRGGRDEPHGRREGMPDMSRSHAYFCESCCASTIAAGTEPEEQRIHKKKIQKFHKGKLKTEVLELIKYSF